MRGVRIALLAGLAAVTAGSGVACSRDTACTVDGRDYYVAMPEGADGPVPAVMYIHGWGGNGKGALRNTGMVDAFTARGYAVISPDGVPREGRNGRSWRFHPLNGEHPQEVAHLAAVKDDAVTRLNLDSDRMLLAGFSIGGSMTAYAACLTPETFAAYAPVGGNFWRPHPESCAGPVRMLHTHGWADRTVPLEGRVVNNLPVDDPEAFAQGDIFHALNIWRETNGCTSYRADRTSTDGPFWRRAWDSCAEGAALEFALFPGGHAIPQGWSDLVIDWFEGP
ncbi:MAG: prolyl oligopeptidase family serine peptidase [Rhodobacteraceae bacterium]|nr:prolyl oligopeptidase family serine peptidase [Paracoccaceae bacterium]